jgi:hypothetical protein
MIALHDGSRRGRLRLATGNLGHLEAFVILDDPGHPVLACHWMILDTQFSDVTCFAAPAEGRVGRMRVSSFSSRLARAER